jgi:hypothetical protein
LAYKILLVDSVTGKRKKAPASLWEDEDFDVTLLAGQTVFEVSEDFTATQKIDTYVNGILQREGVGFDYVRDAITNELTFSYAVPQNSWVLVRVHRWAE